MSATGAGPQAEAPAQRASRWWGLHHRAHDDGLQARNRRCYELTIDLVWWVGGGEGVIYRLVATEHDRDRQVGIIELHHNGYSDKFIQ